MSKLWKSLNGWKTVVGFIISVVGAGLIAQGYEAAGNAVLLAGGALFGTGAIHKGVKAVDGAADKSAKAREIEAQRSKEV